MKSWIKINELRTKETVNVIGSTGATTKIDCKKIEGYYIPLSPQPFEIKLINGGSIFVDPGSIKIVNNNADPQILIQIQ